MPTEQTYKRPTGSFTIQGIKLTAPKPWVYSIWSKRFADRDWSWVDRANTLSEARQIMRQQPSGRDVMLLAPGGSGFEPTVMATR